MANVTFTYNPELPPACYPADVNGLAQLLTQGGMLAGTVPDNAGGGIFVGSSPPSSSLTYKVWFKIDSAGRPLGVYMYYNGNWRKLYTNVGIGEIRMYYGGGENFDGTGLGVIGGDSDGWAICNGNNGTPDLTGNFFPVSGRWDGNGWAVLDPVSGGWQYQGGQGQSGHKISIYDLPDLKAQGWVVTEGTQLGGPGPFFTPANPNTSGATQSITWSIESGGVVVPGTNNTLPLPNYIGFGFLMFVGYT